MLGIGTWSLFMNQVNQVILKFDINKKRVADEVFNCLMQVGRQRDNPGIEFRSDCSLGRSVWMISQTSAG